MGLGPIVLLVYGLLMIVGGVFGFRAGSKASLIAGGASGILILVAWFLTRSNLGAGLWLGTGITLVLCGVTWMRVKKTGKFMPSGMLFAISIVALVLLAYSAVSTLSIGSSS